MEIKPGTEALHDQSYISDLLIDSSPDRVIAIDNNWTIAAWNRTTELMTGINKQTVLGKNLLEVLPKLSEDQEILDAISDAIKGRDSLLPPANNSFNRHCCENHFIPILDKEGTVIGVMNIIHDVTHRIKAEKQLRKLNTALEKKYNQLEKTSNELANFTYITSRDIKEPLKHVYTSLELLIKKEGSTLTNASKGNLRRMQGSLNKINLLIEDITTVSAINTTSEPESEVDLDEILAKTTNVLQNKIDETKSVIESVTLPVINGYKKMLEYLFLNILDNAIKFQHDGVAPRIIVNCNIVKGNPVNKKDTSTEYLKVSFQDNGIGFNQSEEERIFKMFEKLNDRKYHGSGIGLTISRKIMEAHEGYIEGISTPGNGSLFNCYFPIGQED
jgi:PAS domain S-box-containing protein